MKTPHPQAEFLAAIAEGKQMEFSTDSVNWTNCNGDTALLYINHYLAGISKLNVRIKPEPKPDVVFYVNIYPSGVGPTHRAIELAESSFDASRVGILKITINGETSKVSAEVV